MKGMTIRQLAKLCGVGQSTIRRWAETASAEMAGIRAKMAGSQLSKKPAVFCLDETITIVRAGGNELLADLLLENARRIERADRVSRLPNGRQLEEMRRIFGEHEAGIRLDFVMGFSRREHHLSPEKSAVEIRKTLTVLKRKDQPELPGLGG